MPADPAIAQPKLDLARARLEDGTYPDLPDELRDYLVDKLTDDAAERHIGAGLGATAAFEAMLDERLTRPTGTRRRVATIPTGEIIDRYGRMLAYLAPWFDSGELPPKDSPERRTFNLDMVANGWAAPFVIYPSLPRDPDLNLLVDEARDAWDEQRGAWDEFGADVLLGYEYRLCIKLADDDPDDGLAAAFQRCCVDLRSLTDVGLQGWADVPPPDRLWYWTTDKNDARRDLGLLP